MGSNAYLPFTEPLWLSRQVSPYYTKSHRRLQKIAREYVDTHILPFSDEWERQGFVPPEVRIAHFMSFLCCYQFSKVHVKEAESHLVHYRSLPNTLDKATWQHPYFPWQKNT